MVVPFMLQNNGAGSSGGAPTFDLPLVNMNTGVFTLTPLNSTGSGTPTFTRATAGYVLGYAAAAVIADGPTLLLCASGEARCIGARRVSEGVWATTDANGVALTTGNGASALCCDAYGPFGYLPEGARTNVLWPSADITNATRWPMSATASASNATTLLLPAAGDYMSHATSTISPGSDCTVSLLMSGTGTISIEIVGNITDVITTTTLTATPTIYTYTSPAANQPSGLRIGRRTAGTCTSLTIAYAQAEAALFPSTYIPTTTVAVARNADVLTYVTAGNFNNTTGAAIASVKSPWTTGVNPSLIIGETAGQSEVLSNEGGASTTIASFDGASAVALKTGITNYSASVVTVGSTWGGITLSVTGGGAAPNVSSAFGGSMGVGASFGIGCNISGGGNWYGSIRGVKLYPNAANIQALTA